MNKFLKRRLIILVVLTVLAFLFYYSGRRLVEDRIEAEIITLLEKVNIDYDSLDIDLINNQILIDGPRMAFAKQDTLPRKFNCKLSSIQLNGFNIKAYLNDKKICLKTVIFHKPQINLYETGSTNYKILDKDFKLHSNNDIYIESLYVNKASVVVTNTITDSLTAHSSELNLQISEVIIKDSLSEKPFQYKNVELDAKNVYFNLGEYEQIRISELVSDLGKVTIKDIVIKTKYTQEGYYNVIDKERDWYHATIDSLKISNFNIFNVNVLPYYRLKKVQVYKPNIQIIRNKLIADATIYKPLYSKMLRESKTRFEIDTIQIHKGSVVYKETVDYSSNMAELRFSQLDGVLENIGSEFSATSNLGTKIKISGKFMDTADLDLDWQFNVSDENDGFIFRANIGAIDASRFNQFIEPEVNAVLDGVLKKTYFTINGTDYASSIDMKLNYDDFKVTVFRKNSREKNKLLSSLANLFIKKTTDREEDNFRETSKSGIIRNTHKSFFNFVWLNIREGLILAMIGDAGQA